MLRRTSPTGIVFLPPLLYRRLVVRVLILLGLIRLPITIFGGTRLFKIRLSIECIVLASKSWHRRRVLLLRTLLRSVLRARRSKSGSRLSWRRKWKVLVPLLRLFTSRPVRRMVTKRLLYISGRAKKVRKMFM